MKAFKLALIAIILIIGCVLAHAEMEERERGDNHHHDDSEMDYDENDTELTEDARTRARATPKPTPRPTPRPSSRATPAPTPAASRSTSKPTSKPTTKPSSGSSTTGLCDVVPTSTEPLKLLVPLYVYPGSAWDSVAAGASSVGTIAIINPNSGPVASGPDSTYTTYMKKLNTAGVQQIGYVHTSYGSRSVADVQADIDVYASKYSYLEGIFFDEASNSASELAYYTTLYNYVLSKGYTVSILNPGTMPDSGYVSISTNIVVFENSGSSFPSSFSSFVTCASSSSQKSGYKYKFSAIAYGISSGSASSLISKMQNAGIGLVYVTDGASGCCTYNSLVSYYSSEASAVASING